MNQKREAIRKEYAEDIERVRNKAQRRSNLKYVGVVLGFLGFLGLGGGCALESLIIGLLGFFSLLLGFFLIIHGDVDPNWAEISFIDAKLKETE